ncbi:MAG: phosphoribosylglycinamide formyltransferase [Porticoccus sp.]|nr:phosphoribosylglycinamide formyltransferase [Porticoccus sp.]
MTTKNRPRLVVLLSGSGSNLQAFIDATKSGALNADIVAVISNKTSVMGLERGKNAGIASEVVDHREFIDRENFDHALAERIESYKPDLVILAGFMRILTPGFVHRFTGRIMNIHPSLLPKYPGLHTHQRAIEAGDTTAGATVHFVTSELDGGPAIIQAEVPVLPGDNEDALAKRVLVQEHQIYPLAARWFCEGRLHFNNGRPQLDGKQLPDAGFPFSDIIPEH